MSNEDLTQRPNFDTIETTTKGEKMTDETELIIEMIDGEAIISVDDFDEDDTTTYEFKNI